MVRFRLYSYSHGSEQVMRLQELCFDMSFTKPAKKLSHPWENIESTLQWSSQPVCTNRHFLKSGKIGSWILEQLLLIQAKQVVNQVFNFYEGDIVVDYQKNEKACIYSQLCYLFSCNINLQSQSRSGQMFTSHRQMKFNRNFTKQVIIFWDFRMADFCRQVHKPSGSYMLVLICCIWKPGSRNDIGKIFSQCWIIWKPA